METVGRGEGGCGSGGVRLVEKEGSSGREGDVWEGGMEDAVEETEGLAVGVCEDCEGEGEPGCSEEHGCWMDGQLSGW